MVYKFNVLTDKFLSWNAFQCESLNRSNQMEKGSIEVCNTSRYLSSNKLPL